jgi:hypothetical protein
MQASSALLLSASSLRARGQSVPRHAVISLLGDRLEVVYAQMRTGSHLDRNLHRAVPDPRGAMDQFALAAVARALDAAGQPGAALLSLAPSPLHEQAESLFDANSVGLPDMLIEAVAQSQAVQILLLTKHRAPASIPLLNTHLGVGMLRGLGYYIDAEARVRMVETGHAERGVLATYAYFKLTLADARSGRVLNQRFCTAAHPYPVAARPSAIDPWDVLSPTDKVLLLRRLLDAQLALEVPLLLGG